MTSLLAATMLLTVAALPAFACDWNKSASTNNRSSTVASQTANDHAAAPRSAPSNRSSS